MGIGSSVASSGSGLGYNYSVNRRRPGDGSSQVTIPKEEEVGTSVDGSTYNTLDIDVASVLEQQISPTETHFGLNESQLRCTQGSIKNLKEFDELTKDKLSPTQTERADDVLQNDRRTNKSGNCISHQGNEKEDIQKWKIDNGAWNEFLGEQINEIKVKKLLENKILPDEEILIRVIKERNQSSHIVRVIIRNICEYIKLLSPKIRHVWPAYRLENSEEENRRIVFVIHTGEKIEIETEGRFTTYQRCEDEISPSSILENDNIYKAEQSHEYETAEMQKIIAFVKSNARRMMQRHSNLTKVSASLVKSSKVGRIEHTPCIALYVHIKGLVPFNEEAFDRTITEFPIDVREGVFTLCGKPDELHEQVQMGCMIDSGYGTSQGTVGPFVQLQNHKETYFLTSAHVTLNKRQMETLVKGQGGCIYYGISGNKTFQPPESKSVKALNRRYHLGTVELAVYKEGDETEAGTELALVQISKNREPVYGFFPDIAPAKTGAWSSKHSQFSSGRILERGKLKSNSKVYKYGCISGLTEGLYVDDCTSVRTNKLEERGLGVDVTLYNQLQIGKLSEPFAKQGDSGSLVFAIDGDESCAVGIFEGRMKPYYMATPIEDAVNVISKSLSQHKAKQQSFEDHMDFESYGNLQAIQLPFVPKMSKNQISVEELDQKTSGIQTNIIHHAEHNFDSVKEELTAMKVHIDQSNAEMKRYLDEQFKSIRGMLSGRPEHVGDP